MLEWVLPEWMMLPELPDPKLVLFFVFMATVIFFANRGETAGSKPERRQRTVAVTKNRRR